MLPISYISQFGPIDRLGHGKDQEDSRYRFLPDRIKLRVRHRNPDNLVDQGSERKIQCTSDTTGQRHNVLPLRNWPFGCETLLLRLRARMQWPFWTLGRATDIRSHFDADLIDLFGKHRAGSARCSVPDKSAAMRVSSSNWKFNCTMRMVSTCHRTLQKLAWIERVSLSSGLAVAWANGAWIGKARGTRPGASGSLETGALACRDHRALELQCTFRGSGFGVGSTGLMQTNARHDYRTA